jgi:aminobenzoyl-glutamate transport protein
MTQANISRVGRRGWLDKVERFGNALPDPVFIILAFIAVIVLASVIAAHVGWSAVNPISGARIVASSLLSEANLTRLLVDMPATLTSFPPLGLVLVVMMGAAVAERAGLFTALLGSSVKKLPVRFLTPAVFVIGVLSHNATDAAYVVLLPLSAWVYAEAGRHPLLGVAVAYAGISGAFAANLIPARCFDAGYYTVGRAPDRSWFCDEPARELMVHDVPWLVAHTHRLVRQRSHRRAAARPVAPQ